MYFAEFPFPFFRVRLNDVFVLFYLQGKKVKVPTFLVPATQKVCHSQLEVLCYVGFLWWEEIYVNQLNLQVWLDIYTLPVPGSGGKTCSQIFEEAGCDTPASPSCGACLGGPKDTYARMNEAKASYRIFFTSIVRTA